MMAPLFVTCWQDDFLRLYCIPCHIHRDGIQWLCALELLDSQRFLPGAAHENISQVAAHAVLRSSDNVGQWRLLWWPACLWSAD